MTMLTHIVDALRRNPYPLYSVMRRTAPVVRIKQGVWACFDYDSVKRALHDPGTFSSRAAPPSGSPLDWLIFMDPPRHTRLRAIISRTFTPRTIAGLEPKIDGIVDRLLSPALAAGGFDLVTEFADRIPLLVICEMMGMPLADAPVVTRWSSAIMGLGDLIVGGEVAARASRAYAAAKAEMLPYLDTLLAERALEPREDLLTRLVMADVDGEHLSRQEIFGFFQLLLLAGTETTTNLIANSVLCLMDHPTQLAQLRADPGMLPAAIEEVLRFRTPVQMVFRSTTKDVQLGRKTIPAGNLLLTMVGSANRDARHFASPHRFDIAREAQPHVAFGYGAHFCIGSADARFVGAAEGHQRAWAA